MQMIIIETIFAFCMKSLRGSLYGYVSLSIKLDAHLQSNAN